MDLLTTLCPLNKLQLQVCMGPVQGDPCPPPQNEFTRGWGSRWEWLAVLSVVKRSIVGSSSGQPTSPSLQDASQRHSGKMKMGIIVAVAFPKLFLHSTWLRTAILILI